MMLSDETFRARIPPRPRWSVMIPSYNSAAYVREALESVLSQDPGADRMQIEIVDDASHDDTEAVVAAVGRGRVGYYRQPKNVGHVENFTTCLRRSQGELVHLLHADDYVLPGFYHEMERPFTERPDVGAAFCRVRTILVRGDGTTWTRDEAAEGDTSGVIRDWLMRIATAQRVQTPSMVVRRTVYETLGSFDRRLHYSEDWEMWARIAAHFPVWHVPQVLAVYRMHLSSSTSRHARTAETIRDMRRAVTLILEYVPESARREVAADAHQFVASVALATARRSFDLHAPAAAFWHIIEAWRTHRSARTLRETGPAVRDMVRWARRVALGRQPGNAVRRADAAG